MTDVHAGDETLRDDARLAEAVFLGAGEGMAITDAKGRVLKVNDAFTALTGYAGAEVVGQTLGLLKSDRHPPEFFAELWRQLEATGRWQGEIWNRHKDGSIYPEWLSISEVRDAGGAITKFVGVFTDIKGLVAKQEHLRHAAQHDSLTGLPNRMLFNDRFEQAVGRSLRKRHQMALMLIDLDADSPKRLPLIEAAGRQLATKVRETDTMARIGDTEFVVLQESIDGPREVSSMADKLLKILHLPFEADGDRGFVSGSIGISLFPIDGYKADDLIRDARMAMEEARLQGHNTYSFFASEMNAYVGERLLLAGQLRQALERNELSLKYQPQFDANSNAMVGIEVLLRWSNLALGMVGPDRFVPVAEDIGLIHTIGEWVLREACRQFVDWQHQSCAPPVLAVNISAKQIAAADFVEMVDSVLRDSGMDAGCLELELAESVLNTVPYVHQTIEALHQLGVHIAIDDFGTGVTSLGRFTALNFHKLKIDREFIRGIGRDPAQEKVVRAIMGLARPFGVKVIAEGVETEDQARFLRQEGCHEFQGHLLGRAVSAADYCTSVCPATKNAKVACPVALGRMNQPA